MKKQVNLRFMRPDRYFRYLVARGKRASILRRRRRAAQRKARAQEQLANMPVTQAQLDLRVLRIEEQMFTVEDVKEIVQQHFADEVDVEYEVSQALESMDFDDQISDWVSNNLDEIPTEDRIREIVLDNLPDLEDIPDEDAVREWARDEMHSEDHIGDIARDVARDVVSDNTEGFITEEDVSAWVRANLHNVWNDTYRRGLFAIPRDTSEGVSNAVQDYFDRNGMVDSVDRLLRNSDVLASFLRNNATQYMDGGLDDRIRYVLAQHQSAGAPGNITEQLADMQRRLDEMTEKYTSLVNGLAALGTDMEVVESAARTMSLDLEDAA